MVVRIVNRRRPPGLVMAGDLPEFFIGFKWLITFRTLETCSIGSRNLILG